ncbi:cell division protein FtsL [Moraxella pluranimalium]|uniref:Cell division protein FtsL n=1 Tax=Moraxella pluranimalium TaxID=470453 RepID=A0A1T0CLT3_9GAMM|nr:cell division protein FtsL [Moraxella pluranimalium]OOS23121.1 cell division protein FtsL [Moraxella pluranimalium]
MSSPKLSNFINENTQAIRTNFTTVLRVILAILVLLIFWTALSIVEQTNERHQVHIQIRKLDLELSDLRTEEQRLMIEQQTFSATPQVASRAVSELGMFFPTGENRRVIAPSAGQTQSEKQGK